MQILQILHCFRSHFHPEKEQEGELFSLWPAQDGWKHLQKIQLKVFNEILEACLLHVLHEVCGGQVE